MFLPGRNIVPSFAQELVLLEKENVAGSHFPNQFMQGPLRNPTKLFAGLCSVADQDVHFGWTEVGLVYKYKLSPRLKINWFIARYLLKFFNIQAIN